MTNAANLQYIKEGVVLLNRSDHIQFLVQSIPKMFYSFRLRDNNLSSFSRTQRNQVKKFQEFIMKRPDGFCCICLKVLYPEDQYYRAFDNEENLPCLNWKMQPIRNPDNETLKMVCKAHINTAEVDFPSLSMVYPGTVLKSLCD